MSSGRGASEFRIKVGDVLVGYSGASHAFPEAAQPHSGCRGHWRDISGKQAALAVDTARDSYLSASGF